MNAVAQGLVVASAAIILFLGILHLAYTFSGNKLHPRDPALAGRMKEVSPVIARQTTMWRAWIGFNASHSFGAMLFGLAYGYLALFQGALLFASPFLLLLGLAFLSGYVLIGKAYWFSVPFRGIVVGTMLYSAALAIIWA